MKGFVSGLSALSIMALLAACGGGGGGGGSTSPTTEASSSLSTTQTNFEKQVVKDSYVDFDYSIPSSYSSTPVSGTDYFAINKNAAPASPSSGPQRNLNANENLTSTLALPDYTKLDYTRVLKNGSFHERSYVDKQLWTYQGGDVLLTYYSNDGVTPLITTVFDEWSAPIPLTGNISDAAILKSFLGFTRRTTDTQHFDFTKTWLPGSRYFTRKAYNQSDVTFVNDWPGGQITDTGVPSAPVVATTLEGFFVEMHSILNFVFDYGTISSRDGARVWVDNAAEPDTNMHHTFIELRGKIYWGHTYVAGTRSTTIDGVDGVTVHDYQIRLNSKAAESMKQTVKF